MKILIIDAAWYGGGAESVARESYNYFVSCGHECYFAYSRGEIPSYVNGIKIGNKLDVYLHVLKARLLDKNGFGAKKATLKFIEEIKRIKPDIINIHNIVGYVINIKLFFQFLKQSSIKVVWTQHDSWAYTGHCTLYDTYACTKWTNGCGKCPAKKGYPSSMFIERSYKNLKLKEELFSNLDNMTLVTPSKWLKEEEEKTFLNKYNIKVIHNGIDIEKFKPMKSNLREQYAFEKKIIILGVASRWEPRKGLKFFIDLEKIIDKDKYVIVLIGVTKKEQKKIPKNIVTINRTNNIEELIEWYTVADVFVNPTLADNFPTVNLEALACGTPVVTFNTGGSSETIGDKCGIIVQEKKSFALLQAINECIKMSISHESCVSHAVLYNKYDRYKEYIELFKELLSN